MFGKGWEFAVVAVLMATIATPVLSRELNRRARNAAARSFPSFRRSELQRRRPMWLQLRFPRPSRQTKRAARASSRATLYA
jgi:hypothetical protein